MTAITLVIGKYHRWGNSWGIIIPKAVREALGLLPGDLVAIRIVGRRAVMGRLLPEAVLPVSDEEASIALSTDNRGRGA